MTAATFRRPAAPPHLVTLRRTHLRRYGTVPDGRILAVEYPNRSATSGALTAPPR